MPRSFVRILMALITSITMVIPATVMLPAINVAAATPTASELGIPEENMPPTMGQSAIEAYVPETGHSVTGYMLDYWRANGAAAVYGNPISQPFGASNQLYSQAFERGVFQFSPYFLYSDEAAVRMMPIVKDTIKADRSERRPDGRRTPADRRPGLMPASIDPVRAEEVAWEGGTISPITGYSISGTFAPWYANHEGWFYLGAPMSEPMMIRGVPGQMFESGVLLLQDNEVHVAPLPREHPERFGIDTTPVEQADMPVYSEAMFYTVGNPYGVDPTASQGEKHIVVSIADQAMRVYQGDTLVLETLVSTGLDPNNTEIGKFHVRIKFESQTMEGFTNGSGEVIALGDTGDGEKYSVQDVPNVMYINYEAEALHGAYWHNNFGNKMSHGCINLPLDVAAFMFDFSPLGTPVTVIEGSFAN